MSATRPIDDIFEPDDVALRQRLGVRPIYYWAEASTHPDREPCPPWCWAQQGDDDWMHEIDEEHPMVATHKLEPVPTTVATLYRGERRARESQDDPSYVETASIESYLEQVGQHEPIVKLDLCHHPRGKYARENRLRLTVADTEDLISALTFLVKEARR
jgi:hypothetical protein